MDERLARKLSTIRDDLRTRAGVVIAFSGGVDSSVVAAIAHDALGENAIAVTAKSETLPAEELETAKHVATEIGIHHEIIEFSELSNPLFIENDHDRCYHCRTMRLTELFGFAEQNEIMTVCDGTNASDLGAGHRPGLRAIDELDVFSPLAAHGIEKQDVRRIARHYGLSVADKPSMACLSSRIPTGIPVTEERLSRVERAEQLLRSWGFSQFRVRDHDGIARIEVGTDELPVALDTGFAAAANEYLSDLGFEHVTLDLGGYATGSVSPSDGADDGRYQQEESKATPE